MNYINGAQIFKLHDTSGMPLEDIILALKNRGMKFDVVQWIRAAKKAGWKKKKMLTFLLEPLPGSECEEMRPILEKLIEKVIL